MNQLAEVERPLPKILAGAKVQPIVPGDFDSAYRIAQAVCVAGMAPTDLDTPERAFVAIMHGLEVGLPPMQALQSIAVINGRPSIWGDGAIGLVRGSGLCEYIRERIDGEGDAREAICEAKRRNEVAPVIGRFSVADARKAGLWSKKGPWQDYPKRMLQMRARAFALRDGFADVLRGLSIAEEASDIPPPSPPPAPAVPQIIHVPESRQGRDPLPVDPEAGIPEHMRSEHDEYREPTEASADALADDMPEFLLRKSPPAEVPLEAEIDTPTPGQDLTFTECKEWLQGAKTLADLTKRAENEGYQTGTKELTVHQRNQLRALYRDLMDKLNPLAGG